VYALVLAQQLPAMVTPPQAHYRSFPPITNKYVVKMAEDRNA
jgi:hypothetical protein